LRTEPRFGRPVLGSLRPVQRLLLSAVRAVQFTLVACFLCLAQSRARSHPRRWSETRMPAQPLSVVDTVRSTDALRKFPRFCNPTARFRDTKQLASRPWCGTGCANDFRLLLRRVGLGTQSSKGGGETSSISIAKPALFFSFMVLGSPEPWGLVETQAWCRVAQPGRPS
jgi:hypothetical protein